MQDHELGDSNFTEIWNQCQPFTMTSAERGSALFRSIAHIAYNAIPGAIVELGVWRGGSAMIAIKAMQHFGIERDIWLFDTFNGMTAPSNFDVDHQGKSAAEQLQQTESEKNSALIWAYASQEEVHANIATTGYPDRLIHFVKGNVLKTVPNATVDTIALLRLDTDFYDSTRVELEYFYPLLVAQGILIIDDYGHWKGCRLAVDEFFSKLKDSGQTVPFLAAIDYTGRIASKPVSLALPQPHRHDYYPPGLEHARLLHTVPSLRVRDPSTIEWPYLRKNTPHIWRTEQRAKNLPDTGVLSVEEAELLHANARQFANNPGLEIGCHFGWSTAHLLAAGLILDVVDPAIQDNAQRADIEFSLLLAAPKARYRLWPAFSPGVLSAIQGLKKYQWSFAFIDGYHEGDAPLRDAMAVGPL